MVTHKRLAEKMTRLGIFTVVKDGYDRHVVYNNGRERMGAGKWSSALP